MWRFLFLALVSTAGFGHVFEKITLEEDTVLSNGYLKVGDVEHPLARQNHTPFPKISEAFAAAGTKSLMYEAKRLFGKTTRSEHYIHKFAFGQKRYFGFSLFIPAEFDQPRPNKTGKIFWQAWQGAPMSPPIMLKFVEPSEGDLPTVVRTHLKIKNTVQKVIWAGTLEKEKWNRIVVGTRPSYKNEDSWIALWINGTQVARENALIGYVPENEEGMEGAHPWMLVKSGLYQPSGNTYTRLFFDEIYIASSLEETN